MNDPRTNRRTQPRTRVDPVTGAVILGALESIAVEMGHKLMRMSYSSIIRESEDFGAALTDAEGRQLCECKMSTPSIYVYLGADYSIATKAIMRTRPIFHSSDAAIRGHVFCSFLALAMQKHLNEDPPAPGRPRSGMEGTPARPRPPRRSAHPPSRRRLAGAHRRHSRRHHAVQERAHIALPPRARQARPPPQAPSKSARTRRGRPRRHATPT